MLQINLLTIPNFVIVEKKDGIPITLKVMIKGNLMEVETDIVSKTIKEEDKDNRNREGK